MRCSAKNTRPNRKLNNTKRFHHKIARTCQSHRPSRIPIGANEKLFQKQYNLSNIVRYKIKEEYPYYPLVREQNIIGWRIDTRPPKEIREYGGFGPKTDKVYLNGGHSTNIGPTCFTLVREMTLPFMQMQNCKRPFYLYMTIFDNHDFCLIMGERQIVAPPLLPLENVLAVREVDQETIHEENVKFNPIKTIEENHGYLEQILKYPNPPKYIKQAQDFINSDKLILPTPKDIALSGDHCSCFDIANYEDICLRQNLEKIQRDKISESIEHPLFR